MARFARGLVAVLLLTLCIVPGEQCQSDPSSPAKECARKPLAKRPCSAFILYHSSVRKVTQDLHPGLSVKNITMEVTPRKIC
ncbi:hypothetical protein T484DRAFT_1822280 [Baffinella frigidus]|nr:hypothetical protein T484DRAFT_1822280 [Cryptophyta sp. CCMP2293]